MDSGGRLGRAGRLGGRAVAGPAIAVLAAGLIVGGCAYPSPEPPVARGTTAAPSGGSSTRSLPTAPPTALPTEPPIVVPATPPDDSAGATTRPADPSAPLFPDGPCQPSQLDVTAGPVEPALGYRQMRVRVTNHSRVGCVLTGYAVVTARGASGTVFDTPQGRLTGAASGAARTVPLRPGGTAHVDLGWRGDLAAAGVEQTASLTIVVTSGSTPATVPLDPTSPVDVVDGTEVRVGGWRPGAD